MTNEIKDLITTIVNHSIFEKYPLYFVGGTALSTYLDHRISYDIDIISAQRLPVSVINGFMFSIGANPMIDRVQVSSFRINKGEDLSHFHLRFMVNGVKMEFSYFDDPIIDAILVKSTPRAYIKGGALKILSLDDIIALKIVALFSRHKSRDMFDVAILLERGHVSVEELERIYSYKQYGDKTLQKYIQEFTQKQSDDSDTTLDFLPQHEHYKRFSNLSQDARLDACKEMLLRQFDVQQKEKMKRKQRDVISAIRNKER